MRSLPPALAAVMTRTWILPLLTTLLGCTYDAAPTPAAAPVPAAQPPALPPVASAEPAPPAMSAAPAAPPAPEPAPPAEPWTGPRVALTQLACQEQECEGLPSFDFKDFPAVSDDGTTYTDVARVDGWGHEDVPAVLFLDIAGGRLTSVRLAERKWGAASAAPVEARLAQARARLAKQRWVQPSPVRTIEGCKPGADCGEAHVAVAGDLRFDFGKGTPSSSSSAAGWDADTLAVRRGAAVLASPALARYRDHCSRRLVSVAHLDAARGFFVLVGFIGSTGHNCDGKREPRDFGVVRLRK